MSVIQFIRLNRQHVGSECRFHRPGPTDSWPPHSSRSARRHVRTRPRIRVYRVTVLDTSIGSPPRAPLAPVEAGYDGVPHQLRVGDAVNEHYRHITEPW